MKPFVLPVLFIFACTAVHAQTGSSRDAVLKMMADPNFDTVHLKVEIESDFPGGQAGWIKFFSTHLVYPRKAVRKNIQGTVLLQFIVDRDGVVSDIEAVSGPDLLKEAAVNVIRESPRWVPAVQNNRKVKSYKKQPITFRLE